jgi:hypothetical protein
MDDPDEAAVDIVERLNAGILPAIKLKMCRDHSGKDEVSAPPPLDGCKQAQSARIQPDGRQSAVEGPNYSGEWPIVGSGGERPSLTNPRRSRFPERILNSVPDRRPERPSHKVFPAQWRRCREGHCLAKATKKERGFRRLTSESPATGGTESSYVKDPRQEKSFSHHGTNAGFCPCARVGNGRTFDARTCPTEFSEAGYAPVRIVRCLGSRVFRRAILTPEAG